MAYVKKNWQNTPSTNTPINADNLNHMEQGIYDAAATADYAKDKVDDLQGLVYSPLVAATAAAMTDTTKVYVYTGSETGYTSGHWYYYNGTAWADGGVYNSTAFNTDATLSHQGEAADAKATGDAVGNLSNALTSFEDEVDRFENCLGYTENYVYPVNRFDNTDADIQDDYTINSNGDIVSGTDYFVSGYIDMTGETSVKLANGGTSNIAYVATYFECYRENKTKIGTRKTSNNDGTATNLEPNTKYVRAVTKIIRKNQFMVIGGSENPTKYEAYSAPQWVEQSSVIEGIESDIDAIEAQLPTEVKVGTGQTYTSILAALKGTDANVVLHLMAQEFDIEAEYEAYYGASFWSSYDGYSGHADDPFYRGLWLADGRKVYGEAGTKIKFPYSGNNSAVSTYFSVFANGKNTSLENVEIFVNRNVRYSIHDDFKPSDGTVTWKNIIFHGKPHSSSHIGAGLGYGATYYLEGLVFLENDSLYDISYHGVATSNPNVYINKVYVKDCYGTKACAFRWYGPTTGVSPCIVSGSTFGSIYCEAYDADQPQENMVLYKYNCIETAS